MYIRQNPIPMKKIYLSIFTAVFFCQILSAQIFWTENFNNSCSAGCLAASYTGPNGAWTQTITGAEGADPNVWFISCAENGNGPGNCGSGCSSINPNATLHVSAAVGNIVCPNDCGASYDAGGLCGILSCPQTSRRIESPTINCSANIFPATANFVYIASGSAGSDECRFWYFDGTTWTMLQAIPPTINSNCNGQGLWTSINIVLPQSSVGNANVKVAFEWVNNDDGVGSDPSFAVDDLNLSLPLGVSASSMLSFTAQYDAASDLITIQNPQQNGNCTAELYSMDGKKMLSQELNGANTTMNVSALAPGLYILQLKSANGNYSPVRFVVE